MSDDDTYTLKMQNSPGLLSTIKFASLQKTYLTIKDDGSVVIPDDVTMDEAATAFWHHVEVMGPKQELERLRAELDAEKKRAALLSDAVSIEYESYCAVKFERDAARAELAACEWQLMATAPKDGTLILAAVRVYAAGTKRFLYWDIQAVLLDEGLALTSCGDDCGWHWDDFEVWKPIALDGIDAALKGGDDE